MRHRPKVRRWSEETSEGLAWCYTVCCQCGEEFDEHYAKQPAEDDLRAHLTEVAPPPSERCREPRKHRMQSHDHCPVCAFQMVLPGFEELETAG